MSGPTVYPTIHPHKCRSRINTPLLDQYCSLCGIFISQNPSITYLKPLLFSNVNSYIGDQNLALDYMLKKQTIHLHYTEDAFHLPFRLGLVDWLEKTARKLKLNVSTIHLSIAIIDIVLSGYAIPVEKMEIMVFTALNIAGKMEDFDDRLPCLNDVPYYFQKPISVSELQSCEKIVFEVLGYNANIQTPYQFACQFISCGVISNQDIKEICGFTAMNEFERLVSLFSSASLKNYDLCQFEASVTAAAIIACTRKALGFKQIWTDHLTKLTRIPWNQLHLCLSILEQTAFEMYRDEIIVKDLQPTPIKRKSNNTQISTTDKGYGSIENDKIETEKQVFVSRFSFNNCEDDGNLKCTVLDKQMSLTGKGL